MQQSEFIDKQAEEKRLMSLNRKNSYVTRNAGLVKRKSENVGGRL